MIMLFGAGLLGFVICLLIMYLTPYGIKGISAFNSDFKLLDMQLHYTPAKLYSTFETITSAGRLAYIHYLLLDFCFIACFLVVMWSISLWTTSNTIFRNVLIGLAVARTIFDIAENTFLIILINLYPQQNTTIADICSWATTLKFIALFVWIGCVVVTLIMRFLVKLI